jgi:hypothetical protein
MIFLTHLKRATPVLQCSVRVRVRVRVRVATAVHCRFNRSLESHRYRSA